jgi:hypothetical protein
MPSETTPTEKHEAGQRSPQGAAVDSSDPAALAKAIEVAVDYRGDVTLTLASTGETIECYVFDRKRAAPGSGGTSIIRALPRQGEGRLSIPESDIAAVRFTGRDTAAGRSFETWMKKYVQKKLAGESASIESEPLEE